MRLVSGAACGLRSDVVWFSGMLALFLAATGWFVYDGLGGYVAKNRVEARKQLTPLVGADKVPAELGARPDERAFRTLQATAPRNSDAVHHVLGPPRHVVNKSSDERVEYFFSDYGMATVPYRGNVVVLEQLAWTKWKYSKDDISGQFYWAMVPAAIGLYALYRLISALRVHVTIDEKGVNYCGRSIALADLTSLRDYSPKGWVDLYFRGNGREEKIRFDNQKVGHFDQIIDTLCQLRGFPDPRLAEDADDDEPTDQDDSTSAEAAAPGAPKHRKDNG